jgi:hypothetical protein
MKTVTVMGTSGVYFRHCEPTGRNDDVRISA